MRVHFVEHYTGMGMDRTEAGTLLLAKPGRMRWIYDTPAGKVFVLDGHFAWSYTPGQAQAQRIAAKRLDDDPRSPLRLLLGHARLEQELESTSIAALGAGFRITGVPRGARRRVRSLTLDVDAAGVIDHMRLDEVDGGITEFLFSARQENVPLPAADFIFTVPAGVEVMDGLPPA